MAETLNQRHRLTESPSMSVNSPGFQINITAPFSDMWRNPAAENSQILSKDVMFLNYLYLKMNCATTVSMLSMAQGRRCSITIEERRKTIMEIMCLLIQPEWNSGWKASESSDLFNFLKKWDLRVRESVPDTTKTLPESRAFQSLSNCCRLMKETAWAYLE